MSAKKTAEWLYMSNLLAHGPSPYYSVEGLIKNADDTNDAEKM